MFEKTLTDIVKGIRASKRDTSLYISQCIAEIKTEIHSSDMYVKANALQKLTFLHMMGYSMNWASFAAIEVMSSPRFAHKRVGYLAASQGFTQHTEVILLTTNLLKKELRGAIGGSMHGVYEAGLAINCISNIVTEDLATDLLPELTNLTQHPQPYLRKKALLCLYKVFIKYPQGLRLTFARLQQCLEDPNPAVVSCAVNVITELSDKNPRNYLSLAPAFFQLLTESSNNWMLIKVVKLLGSLVPEEPRLARKLLEPLAKIVQQTQAKSLLFEAVHTITLCLPYCAKADGSMPTAVPEIITLCAQTLRTFVEEPDQNLKYLGLVGFGSLMKSHPRVLAAPEYRPLILACLSDQDVTIRTRALDLLTGLVTRKNLVELVSQLLEHVQHARGGYRHDLVAKIIEVCSAEKYSLVADFGWYTDILFRLGHMRSLEKHADLLRAQITDVALRVLPVRTYAVQQSMQVLWEERSKEIQNAQETGDGEDDLLGDNGRGKHFMVDILPAVAWIVGEYSDLIPQALDNMDSAMFNGENAKGPYHVLIQSLVSPWNIQRLATTTQKVYVQSALKVLAAASSTSSKASKPELEACLATLHTNLPIFTQSIDVEVAERAFTGLELLKSLGLETGIPGLTAVDDDDDSDGAPSADLLGLDGKAPLSAKSTSSKSSSLASKIKQASSVLNYLLKPAPMKPVGAKAQRRKLLNPVGHSVDLDAPPDLSIFVDLIEEEVSYRAGAVLTMESISFTQQRPLRVEEKTQWPENNASMPPPTGMGSISNVATPSTSFQKTATQTSSASRQRQGDPFYLDSTPTLSGLEETDKKFGAIQLPDSGDEQESPKRAKKKKKQASRKMEAAGNLGFTPAAAPALYNSDDDDEDDSAMAGKARKSKEYSHLARIDLTTPLRDDEVMPERKHRVVDHHAVVSAPPASQPSSSSKKSKKEKKKSKKKAKDDGIAAEMDLLDLGGFGATPSSAPVAPTALKAPPSSGSNPINSAFDDIFSLAMPSPTQATAMFAQPSFGIMSGVPSSTMDSFAWMKASLKLSKQSGGEGEWSQVQLLYRVLAGQSQGSARLVFRLQNSSIAALTAVTLQLKSGESVSFGPASSGGFAESQEVGPLSFAATDASVELKGLLVRSTSSVPLKFTIPATVFLTPQDGLSIDHVADELSSGEWSSSSVKIENSSKLSAGDTTEVLRAFFQSALVQNSTGDSTAALASRSTATGAKVRIFAKLKSDMVKLEIRSTSAALGGALASDAKKLSV
jgi:AP-3 complex subunit delta-1